MSKEKASAILLCGLNGSGKSTLGRALAQRLGWRFVDNEDLYFPKTDPQYPYAQPRSRGEVERLLLQQLQAGEPLIFASVKGDYGPDACAYFRAALLLTAPRELRLRRVRQRSYERFGARMLPGGDLHEQEEDFFRLVASRPEDLVEKWLTCFAGPILRLDGTRPVTENVEEILRSLNL